MATMTTTLQQQQQQQHLHHTYHQHPSTLYPVVEDLTEMEYGCCPCDDNGNMLGRFPLRFPLIQPPPGVKAPSENAKENKNSNNNSNNHHHRRSSSSSSSLLKRRTSRGSSFEDEITVATEQEERAAKFEDAFVLTRQVFQCTQSQVWECVHRATGLRRCVKIIDFDYLTNSEAEACRREASLLKKVQGREGIIRLCDIFESTHRLYLVMVLGTGGNLLSRVIQRDALPEETIKKIAITVLQTIQCLQSLNLCHNDLQPSNLVLDGMDQVMVIDFGRACAVGEELDHNALHTSYSSPETATFNTCTPVSDIWSLGAVVYFCFFGRAPMPNSKRRTELTFPFNDVVSRQAKQFMTACLHHDPTIRLTAEEALSHPWLAQETNYVRKFSWKAFWKKWFCKKETSNEILTPSTTDSSGIGLSSFTFSSWRH